MYHIYSFALFFPRKRRIGQYATQLCKIVKIHFKVIFRQTCRVPVFILFVHTLHLLLLNYTFIYLNKLNVRNTSYTLRVVPVPVEYCCQH